MWPKGRTPKGNGDGGGYIRRLPYSRHVAEGQNAERQWRLEQSIATSRMGHSGRRAERRKAMETGSIVVSHPLSDVRGRRAERRKAMETNRLRTGYVHRLLVAEGQNAERQWRRGLGGQGQPPRRHVAEGQNAERQRRLTFWVLGLGFGSGRCGSRGAEHRKAMSLSQGCVCFPVLER